MMSASHQLIAIRDSSQPGAARLAAQELAASIGLGESDVHRAGLVATELATNLVKHATNGGELLLRSVNGAPGELEILALDNGPGMRNVTQSLVDGHSTAGSPGTGLGAITRLSDEFDIYSVVGQGTAILTRLRDRRRPLVNPSAFQIGCVSVAKSGERVCGDGWSVQYRRTSVHILMADGLGHGADAADAADAAISAFTAHTTGEPREVLAAVHDGLRHTRGAAGAVAYLQQAERLLKFSGVGNISASLANNGTIRHAVSHNGTLGHEARHFRDYSYPWEPGTLLVMHSDGLVSHWSLDRYPGLHTRQPSLIASVLFRDFRRESQQPFHGHRDDVTVLVAREGS
jgi:anti-sigma regulatory factor (Ser/Thr protein kinase)